jgi:hypothetical protein
VRFAASPRKLVWTWFAPPLDVGAFGDPVAGATGFAVCAYDGGGALLFEAGVAPGGLCDGRACWTALASGGVRYRGGAALADGLTRLVLKPAAGAKARIRVEGSGASLGVPDLPLALLPATVQLVRADDPARCWQASFVTARKNAADAFRARLP